MKAYKLKLSELRTEKKVSQNRLAEVLGVTRQAYSRYERGEHELGYEALAKLAKYFNVSIDYLLGNSTYYYPDSVQALSPEEQKLIKNYRATSKELRPTLMSLSETLAKTPAEIAGTNQQKKA